MARLILIYLVSIHTSQVTSDAIPSVLLIIWQRQLLDIGTILGHGRHVLLLLQGYEFLRTVRLLKQGKRRAGAFTLITFVALLRLHAERHVGALQIFVDASLVRCIELLQIPEASSVLYRIGQRFVLLQEISSVCRASMSERTDAA